MVYLKSYISPIGELTLAGEGDALVGTWFTGAKYYKRGLTGRERYKDLPVLEETAAYLDAYFTHKTLPSLPCMLPSGTDFQKRVWEQLLGIPYGEHSCYGAIAEALQLPPVAARAVGQAVGRNPISLLIPCHRVLGKDGSLTGYAGGMDRKQKLLCWEQEGVRI